MKTKLLKFVFSCTLIFTMGLIFVGCSKENTYTIKADGVTSYEIVKIPDGTVNGSTSEDGLKVTLNKDGKYKFVIKDQDGKKHKITLTYENGNVSAKSNDHLGLTVTQSNS